MMNAWNHTSGRSRQAGAALFTGLILLIVLTVVALTASRSTIMQEKMTANVRETNDAFQSAEDILRQVETRIRTANEAGTVPNVTMAQWGNTTFKISDCSGAELQATEDPANWADAPSRPAGRTMKYRVLEMLSLREGLPCRPDESLINGLPPRSSYYLIVAHAQGPASRGNITTSSTYFYDLGI